MVDKYDPCGVAAAWQEAADKVRELRCEPGGVNAAPWNRVIDQAVEMLEKEAVDARVMGRMAYMLLVGNVTPSADAA